MGPQPWELRKRGAVSSRTSCGLGFNGAAALGAAETAHGVQPQHPVHASMGPQPWELRKPEWVGWRGDGDPSFNGAAALGAAETKSPPPHAGCKIHALQWGRSLGSCGNVITAGATTSQLLCFNGAAALGAAETRRLSAGRADVYRFNGAAALGAAETPSAPTLFVTNSTLQWGRSLGSCGNLLTMCQHEHHFKLQWGRSLGSCGNERPLDAGIVGKGASMGPQPWELRKHPGVITA